MVRQGVVNFEVKKGERTFVFSMPFGAPFGEAYDAAFECLTEIVKMSQEAAEKAKRDESVEEQKVELVQ